MFSRHGATRTGQIARPTIVEFRDECGELPLAVNVESAFENVFAFFDLGMEDVQRRDGGFAGIGSSQGDVVVAAVVVVPAAFVGKEEREIEECVIRTEVDDDAGFAVLFGEWSLDGGLACRGAAGWPKGLWRQAPLVFGIASDAPMEEAPFADRSFHRNLDGIGSAGGFDG